eukprot:tig00000076_g2420.t1
MAPSRAEARKNGDLDGESELGSHVSCTIEMASTENLYDLAVIDEIQMIGDPSRGDAWTRALQGLLAPAVHVCGSPCAEDLIHRLCALQGDKIKVLHYSRHLELRCESTPVSSWSSVRPGDCVVAFSRKEVYNVKRQIESSTRFKCCVVYGGLPPETRVEQAKLFNRHSDSGCGIRAILVATDAIGMGLNLKIGRVVFSEVEKFDGKETRPLTALEVKQIAGRAGRFGGRFSAGFVSALDPYDLDSVRDKLQAPTPNVKAAGLFPSFDRVQMFADAMEPGTSLYSILKAFADVVDDGDTDCMENLYFLRDIKDMLERIGALLHGVLQNRVTTDYQPYGGRRRQGRYDYGYGYDDYEDDYSYDYDSEDEYDSEYDSEDEDEDD